MFEKTYLVVLGIVLKVLFDWGQAKRAASRSRSAFKTRVKHLQMEAKDALLEGGETKDSVRLGVKQIRAMLEAGNLLAAWSQESKRLALLDFKTDLDWYWAVAIDRTWRLAKNAETLDPVLLVLRFPYLERNQVPGQRIELIKDRFHSVTVKSALGDLASLEDLYPTANLYLAESARYFGQGAGSLRVHHEVVKALTQVSSEVPRIALERLALATETLLSSIEK